MSFKKLEIDSTIVDEQEVSVLLDVPVHPSMRTKTKGKVEILHKSNFYKSFWSRCCPTWDYQYDRQYFYVFENSIEQNIPIILPTFLSYGSSRWCRYYSCIAPCIAFCFANGCCSCIPRTSCCHGADVISKTYFDRGIFDRQAISLDGCCCFGPILTGNPKFYNGTKYVCCCMDCPNIGNQCIECYYPYCCGDRVQIQPYQRMCGIEMTTCWLCNCCSLCGPKDGEPLCFEEVVGNLAPGEAEPLRNNLELAYNAWYTRLKDKHEHE